MSGANAPKLTGPVSITVKNIWQFNLCASKKKACGQIWNIAIFIPRNGDQTVLDRMPPVPNLIFQRGRCFAQI